LQLCRLAGWNQTRDDWLRLIDYEPFGCFAAVSGDRVVGTVTTTRYGQALAWIGMMLVHPEWRRRGIATGLMAESLGYLDDCDVGCVKLDATPAGQAVYEKLGFRVEWSFQRWQRDSRNNETGNSCLAFSRAYENPARALDVEAFGCDRTEWLRRLAAVSSVRADYRGSGMLRSGHLAYYLGPVTAQDCEAAQEIVQSLLAPIAGLVFWDIPQPNADAVQLARSLGFQSTRTLMRMWSGPRPITPNLQLQYAISGPATG
jgi:GNAT superfamily N-acetyltransferase